MNNRNLKTPTDSSTFLSLPKVAKGEAYGRIIKSGNSDNRYWEYHATKGWRNYRIAKE